MDRFMAEHPGLIFRPREAVPGEFEEVCEALGERGPQLWKNLRHHLADAVGISVGGGELTNFERNRQFGRQQDAESSRMSVATGYTGMGTQTVR